MQRVYIIAFATGIWLLQQQAHLPDRSLMLVAGLALGCLILSVACFIVWRQLHRKPLPRSPTRHRHAGISAIASKGLVVVLLMSSGFYWAALVAHWRLSDELPHAWQGRDIELTGIVASLPQASSHSVRFEFDTEQILTPDADVPHHIQLSWYLEGGKNTARTALPPIQAGERWKLTVRLKRPHGQANPHGFDFEGWALERNIRAIGYVRKSADNHRLDAMVNQPRYQIERLRQNIRQHFLSILPDAPYNGVMIALAIGDQHAIPQQQWQLFTRTGTNHLMSISGLHITMVSGLIFSLVYWLWCRSYRLTLWLPARKAAIAAGLLTALLYTLLAGSAIPAQRTLYMLAVLGIALWAGRFTSATLILSWALLAVLVIDPWATLSAGFWLSFGAIAIILLVTTGRTGKIHWLNNWIRIQWGITIGLIPALLLMFQQISLISPVANALAIPLVSLAVVPMTLLATLPALDFMLAPAAHTILGYGMDALQWIDSTPYSTWKQHAPPLWTILAGISGIIWMLLPGGNLLSGFPARWLGMIAIMPMFLVTPPRPATGELWLTVLDVGHGLAVVARTASKTLLYDSGPAFNAMTDSGNRIITPFLQGEGIHYLDGMIVSHADADHSGGALSVLETVPVNWILSSLTDTHPLQQAAAGKIRSHRCQAGASWQWDGIRFDILHPTETDYNNSRQKTNALSCVLKITTAQGSILLPADIEKQSEKQLVRYYGSKLASTVLIAPHHGSKTSSSEAFLQQVNPRFAIFTAGYMDRFGHPAEEVTRRYQALGINQFRSDAHGALLLRFSGHTVTTEAWRESHHRYWYNKPVIGETGNITPLYKGPD